VGEPDVGANLSHHGLDVGNGAAFDLPPLEFPAEGGALAPSEEGGALPPAQTEVPVPLQVPVSQVPVSQVPVSQVPVSRIPVSQVSMFRGGLQRAEPAPELPLMPPVPTLPAAAPVSYTSSTYAQPMIAAAPPGQGRALLVQALEELSVVRGALDRLLAGRLGVSA
jgi:hypothetical protein